MKILPAGTTKYLLIDNARVERNAERARAGSPIGLVVEIVDGKPVQHRCHTFSFGGEARLFYTQQRPLRLAHALEIHAAVVTEAEVVLDADLADPRDTPDPASPAQPSKPTRKSQKNPE